MRGGRIDVAIPVFNAAATVEQALDSILRQTVRDIHVIVIDDGSTDATPSILARIAAADRRVNMVAMTRAERPGHGIGPILNIAMSYGSAPFVARFDADDIAYPQRFERQLAYLEANPDCVAVGCEVDHIDGAGRPLEGLPQPAPPMDSNAWSAPAREPYLIHPYIMARRIDLMAVGGYRDFPTSQDSDLLWRLAGRGRLHNLPERLGQYRIHADSTSGAGVEKARVMAVWSQLAALSAQRRARGRADIDLAFAVHAVHTHRHATLDAMAGALAGMVVAQEQPRFRLAVGAKLLQLATFRPFEPAMSDCRFIARAMRTATALAPDNRAELQWYVATTAARLMRRGRPSEALALAGARRLPEVAARAIAHAVGLKRGSR
jgi:glycosyltransferase involved in cell wall biosynthesis